MKSIAQQFWVVDLEARGCVDRGAEESVLIIPSGPKQSGNVMRWCSFIIVNEPPVFLNSTSSHPVSQFQGIQS